MDNNALTSAALDNLRRESLPIVIAALDEIRLTGTLQDETRSRLRAALIETSDLMNLVLNWTVKPQLETTDTNIANEPMSDDEAARLMAEMDAPSPQQSSESAMSDDEAQRLLAEMDAPTPVSEPKIATQPPAREPPSDTRDIPEIEEWESNDFASDPEMMKDFQSNSTEIMQTLDECILRLEQNPESKDTIEEIFRAAHTLKGASGMFGFRAIERLTHRLENLFDNVRKGKLTPTSDTIDIILVAIDCLKKLIEAVFNQEPSGIKTAPIIRHLEDAAAGRPAKIIATQERPNKKKNAGSDISHAEKTVEKSNSHVNDDKAVQAKKKTETSETIRVDLEKLDALVNLVGELVIDRTKFQNIAESMRLQNSHGKYTSSMTETLQQFGRHMNEIQEIIMKVRMVPVGTIFNKYPRIVRDLARQLGKNINLVIQGEETEFDKTLVEQIADPLVHLIRNACDHGIESPDSRAAAGKDEMGTVILSAKQEGNQIVIQIADDGKGMDVKRIRSKGVEKGLIKSDAVLSDHEIFNLIFEPGFSTAEAVTTVSGRGVGMDVVRKQISKLKGTVDIDSAVGKGSTITIRLPLTLAIVHSLMVEVGEETVAIPLNSVIESIRIKTTDIQTVGESSVLKLRDKVIPIYHLESILGLDRKHADSWYGTSKQSSHGTPTTSQRARSDDRKYAVIIGNAERRYGVVVDSLINQQEMVIKPLGNLMQGIPCIAGGAILGDGEVVLVMDTAELEDFHKSKKTRISAA
jgi:two-component system chemotaxis sensor kinase CheA